MWRHTPITPVLRRPEDLKLKGSLCCTQSSNTNPGHCVSKYQKTNDKNKQNKTKPKKKINQMNKIQIKAMKGWSRGRLFLLFMLQEGA